MRCRLTNRLKVWQTQVYNRMYERTRAAHIGVGKGSVLMNAGRFRKLPFYDRRSACKSKCVIAIATISQLVKYQLVATHQRSAEREIGDSSARYVKITPLDVLLYLQSVPGALRSSCSTPFPAHPLTEADTYRRAESRLRELRRAADPRAGFYLHLIYGEDEADASRRLLAQLRR